MGVSVLISAWPIGALGGLQCLAMCGGFLAATSARDAGAAAPTPLLPAATALGREVAYHDGRIATYMILGAAFGTTGALAMNAAALAPLQRTFYFAANTHRVGPAPRRPIVADSSAANGRSTSVRGAGPRVGLVPCALVYSVLPLAPFAGGPTQGALVMLAFGIGTTPNLLALGMIMRRSRRTLDAKTLRFTAAAILIAFGVLGLWRVYVADGALNQGPFCIGLW